MCLRRDLEHDMDAASSLCRGLLGPLAIEDSKTEWGRRLTIIGWDLDLDNRLVAIARKNALKAFYGYAARSLEMRVPMRMIESWAAWAERYGEICLFIRLFRRVLYGQVRRELQHTSTIISHQARRVVRLYQALLALTLLDELRFTRSLGSFGNRVPTLVIEYDGSLSGSGIIWYRITYEGGCHREVALGGAVVDLRALHFGSEAAFQNCAEFMSLTLGVVGAV